MTLTSTETAGGARTKRRNVDHATDDASTRSVQAEATRSRILAITIAWLEDSGENSLRISEIAAAAGVSIGALYHHFNHRLGLVTAARAEQYRGAFDNDFVALRRFVESVNDYETLRVGLLESLRVGHSSDRASNRWVRAEVLGVARHNPDLASAIAVEQRRLLADFAEIIELGQQRSLVDPAIDARSVALAFMSLQFGRIFVDLDGPTEPDEAWLDLMDRFIGESLRPAGRED